MYPTYLDRNRSYLQNGYRRCVISTTDNCDGRVCLLLSSNCYKGIPNGIMEIPESETSCSKALII